MLTNYTPTIKVPTNTTILYAEGWIYGDWWLSMGGSRSADASPRWPDEKCNGFWDRLKAA